MTGSLLQVRGHGTKGIGALKFQIPTKAQLEFCQPQTSPQKGEKNGRNKNRVFHQNKRSPGRLRHTMPPRAEKREIELSCFFSCDFLTTRGSRCQLGKMAKVASEVLQKKMMLAHTQPALRYKIVLGKSPEYFLFGHNGRHPNA